MKVLNDFYCPECGRTRELLVENTTKAVDCQDCPGRATRVLTAMNFQLEGTSGDYPTAHANWAKRRQQKMQEEIHNS